MASLTLPSPAKINRFLHIVGRRTDGYHLLQTVFQFIDLNDTLHFSLFSENKIELISNIDTIKNENNLIIKAAKLLKKVTQNRQGMRIVLEKQIPIGGGLGGGSSNAATTLLALNTLWNLNLPLSTLMRLGAQLGADVPFFIYGHAAWGEGIGDELTPVTPDEPWVLLLIPPCQISTPKLYSDPRLTRDTPRLRIEAVQLSDSEQGSSTTVLKNDFETVAKLRYPEVSAALNWLNQFGTARMSGSGSTVFALFDSYDKAKLIMKKLPDSFKGWIVKSNLISPLAKKAIDDKIANYKWGVAKR